MTTVLHEWPDQSAARGVSDTATPAETLIKELGQGPSGEGLKMKSRNIPVIATVALLAVLGGMAVAAQDKSTVQVPNGLALSECRGYDDWPGVAVQSPDR